MSITDKLVKSCPYCGYKTAVKEFGTWEREGKKGLLGKTPEGFIMLLCPKCENHIKYDTLSNKFLRQNQKAWSGTLFNLILFILISVIIYFVVRTIF